MSGHLVVPSRSDGAAPTTNPALCIAPVTTVEWYSHSDKRGVCMSVEVELKAVVREPAAVAARLEGMCGPGREEIYRDTYYDGQGEELGRGDRELRVRTVVGSGGVRTVLTYKGPRLDGASEAKPEYETEVADAKAVDAIVRGLGYRPVIRFEKHCRNYALRESGWDLLATLVRVPELNGTFIEIEAVVAEGEVASALGAVRSALAGLGIHVGDLTTELYTEAVAKAR
ncbi:class IV adenylate cyclase [Kitasatospora sp. NPDC096147]|uniref:class IV adenylate cyclase n=1 Tax=Kitasatospora sp. NPDC096147 TaxID=3364093 RepID=UPI0037FAEC65